LRKNHLKGRGVWLVYRRKGAAVKSISYEASVDEALAYGWIDSLIKRIDGEKYARKFTPRKPWSIWSRFNIERVEKLKEERRMTKWGLEAFTKRTSDVSLLEKFNAEKRAKAPKDLEDALRANKRAWNNFQGFAPSYRQRYVMWVSDSKRPETRSRRIADAVELISQNVKELTK